MEALSDQSFATSFGKQLNEMLANSLEDGEQVEIDWSASEFKQLNSRLFYFTRLTTSKGNFRCSVFYDPETGESRVFYLVRITES